MLVTEEHSYSRKSLIAKYIESKTLYETYNIYFWTCDVPALQNGCRWKAIDRLEFEKDIEFYLFHKILAFSLYDSSMQKYITKHNPYLDKSLEEALLISDLLIGMS